MRTTVAKRPRFHQSMITDNGVEPSACEVPLCNVRSNRFPHSVHKRDVSDCRSPRLARSVDQAVSMLNGVTDRNRHLTQSAVPHPLSDVTRAQKENMRYSFHRFAHAVADAVGSPAAFVLSLVVIALWGITGPTFRFSDTWQLIINTATTIITFLMVFLIQNTQNRDSRAVHLKLDELIRSIHAARNQMVGLENFSDEELDALQQEFATLREHAEQRLNTIQEHRIRRRRQTQQRSEE